MKDKLFCERLLYPLIVVNKTEEEEVTLIPILLLISDLEQVVEKNVTNNDVDTLLHVIPLIYEQLKNTNLMSIKSYIDVICIQLQRILDILRLVKTDLLSFIEPEELLNNEVEDLISTTRMLCAYKDIDYYNFKEEVEHYE